MDHKGRQQRLQNDLSAQHLDALVVTHLPNIFYLCGFSGSAGVLLLSEKKAVFFTDGRYIAQARTEVQGSQVVIGRKSPLARVGEWLSANRRGLARKAPLGGGIESERLTVAAPTRLARVLPTDFRFR